MYPLSLLQMTHPVIPTDFPADPAFGDIHTFHNSEWEWTNIGWVKREIVLTSTHKVYDGLLTNET